MVKSAKERMREYRKRLLEDPERAAEVRSKERQRWKNRNVPKINKLSPRQKHKRRSRWIKASSEYRERQKKMQDAIQFTPPGSPENSDNEDDAEPQEAVHVAEQNINPNDDVQQNNSGSGKRGRKPVLRKQKMRAFRENERLVVKVGSLLKLSEKYKKRAQRAEQRVCLQKQKQTRDTPRRATQQLLGDTYVTPEVRKILVFHHCLLSDISSTFTDTGNSEKDKQFGRDDDLINRWCIVDYDNKPYVGKVLTQDQDSVEIQN